VKPQGCEPERSIERLLLQVCAESKDFKHLEVFEGCHKGCEQKGFPEDAESWKSSRRIRPSKLLKDSAEKLYREELRRHRKFACAGEQVFTEEYLVHFVEIIRKDGWSKFFEENSRSPVSH
jgi:hypothetical protein